MSSILVTGATGTVGALTGSQALDYYEVARSSMRTPRPRASCARRARKVWLCRLYW